MNYTLEELIDEQEFKAWVLHGENQKEWELFLESYPEFKTTVNKARKTIEILHDNHDRLSNRDILKIWKNIEKFDWQIQKQSRLLKLHKLMRYAAVITIALLIASSSYWIISQSQHAYVFSTTADTITANQQSKLFLSDGTKVDLKTKNSKISLTRDQQIVIDNKQIIDLGKNEQTEDSKMNEVIIPYGKKSQLILEDGTKVWLNAGSRMAFPSRFNKKKREVFLEGEAYFEVAHNKSQPFWVNTNDISIRVLGTKFNISAYRSDYLTEAVLIEGKVSVSERSTLGFLNEETILSPHQKASYNKEKQTISVRNEPDVEFVIAWTEGWFKFSKQSLNEVLNKLQRYYNVQFVYDNEFSTSDLISGKLDLKDSIDQVMNALSDVANLHYRYCGTKVKIEKKITKLNMKK